ncbi:MAG: T9SS type A sorting domain-containing protein [Ignavibacteria bacterium]|nr:T9SS type A sorting domain-containing protein [Ignavibacteria bacterium]
MKNSIIKFIVILSLLIFSGFSHAQTGWFMQNSRTSEVLRGVSFINSQTGWAVGHGGVIVKTTNGGTNWFPQSSGTSQGLISVKFINEYTGWAVGGHEYNYTNIILKTTNGGQSWFTQYYSTSIGIAHELFFINSNTGWIACSGNNGKVLKTMNGGQNWTVLNTGVNTNITSCFFLDQNVGWVIGDYGAIFKTTNGGNSWVTQYCNTTQGLLGLYILNSSTGHVTGHNGIYFKTTNGGLNWISKSIGYTIRMVAVYFVNVNKGWMVGGSYPGGDSQILKTTNGGDNWVSQTKPTTLWLDDIMFVNSNTGWLVGNQGTILKTLTGGEPLPVPTLVSPPNGSNNVPLTPTLFWNHISGVIHYKVQVSRVSNFSALTDSATVTINQYPIPSGKLTNITTYFWRVNATNSTGTGPWSEVWNFSTIPVGIKKISSLIPEKYNLYQNYPNPFNPETNIKFDIPKASNVKIIVYDNLGRIISEIANKKLSAGSYEVEWDASGYPSGLYFYKIVTEEFINVKKMILIK